METYFQSEFEALKIAIANEEKSYNFYTDSIEKAGDPFTINTFKILAEREKKHIEDIKKFNQLLSEKLNRKGVLFEFEKGKFDAKSFFKKTFKEFKDKIKFGVKHLELYEVAMEIEKTGYEFYKLALEKAKIEKLKTFFQFLVDEESNHFLLLQNEYEYLKNPSEYYLGRENWMFEG